MSFFQPSIPYISNENITSVDTTNSYYLGLSVFFIVMMIAHKLISNNPTVYKLDSTGCILDENGTRVKEPIYGTTTVYRNGTWVTQSNGVIIGYNECSKPTSIITKYFIAISISAVIGLIAGSTLYNIQFSIANPQLSANIYANQKLAESRRYPW